MKKFCRTCLQEITDPICLASQNWEKIKFELLFCVPELEIDLVSKPSLCSSCLNVLQLCYQFKNLCLGNEQYIYRNMQCFSIVSNSCTLSDILERIQESHQLQKLTESFRQYQNISHNEMTKAPEENSIRASGHVEEQENEKMVRPPIENFIRAPEQIEAQQYQNITLKEITKAPVENSIGPSGHNEEQENEKIVRPPKENSIRISGQIEEQEYGDIFEKVVALPEQNSIRACDYIEEPYPNILENIPKAPKKSSIKASNNVQLQYQDITLEQNKEVLMNSLNENSIKASDYIQEHINSVEIDNIMEIETQPTDESQKTEICTDLETVIADNTQFVTQSEEMFTTESNFFENITELDYPQMSISDTNTTDESISSKQPIRLNLLNTRKTKYTCSLCDYSTNSKDSFSLHKGAHSNDLFGKIQADSSPNPKFLCTICKHHFGHKENLLNHMTLKHDKMKSFCCSICDYICYEESNLIKHMGDHVMVQGDDVITID